MRYLLIILIFLIACEQDPINITNIDGNYRVESYRDTWSHQKINWKYYTSIEDNKIKDFNLFFNIVELDLQIIGSSVYVNQFVEYEKMLYYIEGAAYQTGKNLVFEFDINFGEFYYRDIFYGI